MSNPGVIVLSDKKLGSSSFTVEDNIGEAIHLHYGNIRLDLTVKEYIALCDSVKNSLVQLINIDGFNIDYFDPKFLDMISEYLFELEKVEFKKIKLLDLKIRTYALSFFPVIRSLNKSRVYKALCGNTKEEERYQQENYRLQSNLERVAEIHNSVKENGYPYNNNYIVLFNNQNVIRDGQHRAASLYFEKGNIEVDVLVLKFRKNKYNVSMHPWFFLILSLRPRNWRPFLKKVYRFAKKIHYKLRGILDGIF